MTQLVLRHNYHNSFYEEVLPQDVFGHSEVGSVFKWLRKFANGSQFAK